MGTIASKLQYLKDTKNLIKGALKAKNVSVSDSDTFRSYVDKIKSMITISKTKLDTTGLLSRQTITLTPTTFSGIKKVGQASLYGEFADARGYGTGATRTVYGDVNFSDLTEVELDGMTKSFAYTNITSVSLPKLTTVGEYGLENAFYSAKATNVSLPKLTTVGVQGLYWAFASNLITSVSLPELTTLGDSALESAFNNNRLTSFSIPKLKIVTPGALLNVAKQNGGHISTLDFSSLETINIAGMMGAFANGFCIVCPISFPKLKTIDTNGLKNAFNDSTAGSYLYRTPSISFPVLTSIGTSGMEETFRNSGRTDQDTPWVVTFSALTSIGSKGLNKCFYGQTMSSISFPALTTSSFGSSTDCFDDMLGGVENCTVHFPASIQSTIGSWTSVTNGFGGTNTTVLFDL